MAKDNIQKIMESLNGSKKSQPKLRKVTVLTESQYLQVKKAIKAKKMNESKATPRRKKAVSSLQESSRLSRRARRNLKK